MAKKLTANQKQYKSQIKRIRRNLTKMKQEGYDVDELLDKYTYADMPKRVTSSRISELKQLTAPVLRTKAEKNINISNIDSYEAPETESFMPKPTVEPEPPTDTYTDTVIEQPDGTDEFTDYDFTPDYTTDDTSEYQYEDYEVEDYEPTLTQEVDKVNGQIIERDEFGTIHNTYELAIEETDDTILYINAETGEIISEEPKDFYNTPDLSDMTVEYFRDLVSGFSPQVSSQLNDLIDKLIDKIGAASLADAFSKTIDNHPNISERLANAKEKYGAVRELFGEIAENLDMSDELRDEIRDSLVRDSMSDMEEYI